MTQIARRSLMVGLGCAIAAPSIVSASSLLPSGYSRYTTWISSDRRDMYEAAGWRFSPREPDDEFQSPGQYKIVFKGPHLGWCIDRLSDGVCVNRNVDINRYIYKGFWEGITSWSDCGFASFMHIEVVHQRRNDQPLVTRPMFAGRGQYQLVIHEMHRDDVEFKRVKQEIEIATGFHSAMYRHAEARVRAWSRLFNEGT